MLTYRLEELRKSIGMNKKEFANYLGLKYTTYNNYETGTREPDSDFLRTVADKFNVSIDYLLGRKETMELDVREILSISELSLIRKYRDLDAHGKTIVNFVVEEEYNRVIHIEKEPYMMPVAAHAEDDADAENLHADEEVVKEFIARKGKSN